MSTTANLFIIAVHYGCLMHESRKVGLHMKLVEVEEHEK
jgi:hypothetical protein